MKLSHYPTEQEWEEFARHGPGSRMYNGKMTLFYNGEKLWDGENRERLIYNYQERQKWEVIIVLPGVEVIPQSTFEFCENVKVVIMADTVRRIEYHAFYLCDSIGFIKLSRNIEYIGGCAFYCCESLTSIFIPPSCREIYNLAFYGCVELIILGLPQLTQLGKEVFQRTALIKKSPIETDEYGEYALDDEVAAIDWIKSINNEEYALHRACSSFNPSAEIIHGLVNQHGIKSMRMENSIGITPSQYLAANPSADVSEKEILNKNVLDSMGELF